MKSTLFTIAILLSLSSCQFPKEYDCICTLTVTTDGTSQSAGSMNGMLYGKKNEMQKQCRAQEAKYNETIDDGISVLVYTASCDIE